MYIHYNMPDETIQPVYFVEQDLQNTKVVFYEHGLTTCQVK